MSENLQQNETLGTASPQADAGTPAEQQANVLQEFFTGLFKAKEAPEKEKPQEEDPQSEVVSGLSKEDVAASIEEAKKQWFAELEEAERKKGLTPEAAALEEQATTQKEVADLKQQLLERDLRAKATKELDALGYPVGLAELLKYESEDSMTKSLVAIQDAFKSSLEVAIKQRLKGKTPEGLGGTGNPQNDLRDQIAKGLKG